jgi:uncharacterized DUF497 family protein
MGENSTCSLHDGKRAGNLAAHGYDFADIAEVFDGRLMVTRRDDRKDYGEPRYVTSTPRGGKFHLISVRPASQTERMVFDAEKKAR